MRTETQLQQREKLQHMLPRLQGAYLLRHGSEQASEHCKRLGKMWDEEHVNGRT